jgi:ZIP family zinc transporter
VLTVLFIAGSAAVASVLGGLASLWRTPTTLFMSVALGFASGVLLATISFEMIPKALEQAPLIATLIGFAAGFAGVYAFDLYVHRGQVAGPASQQHAAVERAHRHRRPRGDDVTVLAGGTSVEELIEGVTIGVGTAIEPALGGIIGVAVAIDNFGEGLSIGELIRGERFSARHTPARRVMLWTSVIGVAVLSSALVGWFLLRDLSQTALAVLFALGAGGMFYLTVTKLVPEAEERQYQQSAAIAIGIGFMLILILSRWMRASAGQ